MCKERQLQDDKRHCPLSRRGMQQSFRSDCFEVAPRFSPEMKVMMFGSYAKGHPHEWSDIDVAVIVPKVAPSEWLETSTNLCHDIHKVNVVIEPILLESGEDSPIYREVMRTGVAV